MSRRTTKTAPATPATPPGATLHLGGDAWAHPDLEPLLVPLSSVEPFPGNPRRHDQPAITASVRDHGLYAGVAVQRSTGLLVLGHGRRQAVLDLGGDRLPVTYLDINDTQAATIVARDNRTSDLGGYDDPDLLALITRLTEEDVPAALLGFTDTDLLILTRRVEAEDVFTVGAEGLLDEFRGISGQDGTDYQPEYASKVAVYLRDEAAIADFKARLGVTEDMGHRLNFPLDWQPYDRRQTWQQERDGE